MPLQAKRMTSHAIDHDFLSPTSPSNLIIREVVDAATQSPGGPAKHHGIGISILAYADDLVRNRNNLQRLLGAATSSADILNLVFWPDKCAILTLTNNPHTLLSTHTPYTARPSLL